MPGGRQCLQRWRGGRGCRRARGCTASCLPRRSLLTRPLWLWASDEGSRLPHRAHTSVGGVPSECRASNPVYAPPLCGSRVDADPKRRGGLHSPAESPADKTGSEIPPALTSLAWTGWWGCGGCVCFLGLSQVVRGVAAPRTAREESLACSRSRSRLRWRPQATADVFSAPEHPEDPREFVARALYPSECVRGGGELAGARVRSRAQADMYRTRSAQAEYLPESS